MIKDILEIHQKVIKEFINNNEEKINSLTNTLKDKILSGASIFIAGNGGSMSDSLHMTAELVGKFYKVRKPISAFSLGTNPSLLSATSNDYSFNYSFQRELEGIAKKGDVFIGISTSGRSKNILNALNFAKSIGCFTAAFTGEDVSEVKNISDVVLSVPSNDVPRIQECHIFLIHIICQILEERLYED